MSSLLCATLTLLVPTPPHVRNTIHSQCRTAPINMLENDLFDSPLPASIDADAAALLEEVNGDVEKARQSYMGYTLAYLEEAMPELYRQIKTDVNLPDAHAAMVELTWDAIAAFMPMTHASRPSKEAAQRLTAIARASLPAGGADKETTVLDVGCGNGVLLPFLTEIGLPASGYTGIDVSSEMIKLANFAHGDTGAAFEPTNFADIVADGDKKYDTIIFNGALQFFDDQPQTMKDAAQLLSDSPDARIIVSHISGASFVRREFGDNPATVKNTMPMLEMMNGIADANELVCVLPSFLGTGFEEIELALEKFYLMVFRRKGVAGDEDVEEEGGDEKELALEMPEGMGSIDLK